MGINVFESCRPFSSIYQVGIVDEGIKTKWNKDIANG